MKQKAHRGIEILANQEIWLPNGWGIKPEHCAHVFNWGGYMGDSPKPNCLMCKSPNPKFMKHTNLYNEIEMTKPSTSWHIVLAAITFTIAFCTLWAVGMVLVAQVSPMV